jgi:quinol monooxygenase YgiN
VERVARYAKLTADEGRGGDVAERLLRAAEAMRGDPGCELYLVSRQRDAPDVVWVTEVWRSQADLERVAADAGEGDDVAEVMAMMRDFAVVEHDLAGGKGPGDGA